MEGVPFYLPVLAVAVPGFPGPRAVSGPQCMVTNCEILCLISC